jgi:hypothetical protein
MKAVWTSTLALSLVILATQARAQDPWRAVPEGASAWTTPTAERHPPPEVRQASYTPPASQGNWAGLGKPVPSPGAQRTPAVSLGQPSPMVPRQDSWGPAGGQWSSPNLVRAQAPGQSPKSPPAPSKPRAEDSSAGRSPGLLKRLFQRAFFEDEPQPLPAPKPLPGPPAPKWTQGPVTSEPVVGGAVIGGPVIAGPVVAGPGEVPFVDMGGCPDCGGEDCPGGCGDDCCGLFGCFGSDCDGCCGTTFCGGNRYYIGIENLLWWIRGQGTPPLVTTGSLGDPRPGALNLPGTSVLFGGNQVGGNDALAGFRGTFRYWFNPQHCLGLEFGGFFLEQDSTSFGAASLGGPQVIARPFLDVSPNPALAGQSVEGVAAPGQSAGAVSVTGNTTFWGAEANLRWNIFCGCRVRVDYLFGFRSLGMDEDLTIQESVLDLRPGMVGDTFQVSDRFEVENRFYGPQFGLDAEIGRGRWFLNLRGKIAMGSSEQVAMIHGSSANTRPGVGTTRFPDSGLLAQPTNSGRFSRQVFAVVPEVGLNVGYRFTPNIRGFVGYNFLYWSRVARAGNQIDFAVNSNQVAPPIPGGPARPAFNFNGSEFWAQGLNFGLEFKW